jgi:hypothetical protein
LMESLSVKRFYFAIDDRHLSFSMLWLIHGFQTESRRVESIVAQHDNSA